ncbi:MAG TPA: PIG-L family deacetylase [Acidimicrobiales bacterium]
MATLVCFHAHPDDESMTTGGTIARAKAEGHRVVLVVATNGEYGEVPEDLGPEETLVERRHRETAASAAALGIDRVVWLGYEDSGMTGWEQNSRPTSFLQADLDEAAGRLAAVLREEGAEVLTTYDWHGNYGHPDHIKVHHVGHRAAVLAGTPRVLEATVNRDHIVRLMAMARETGESIEPPGDEEFDPNGPADDGNPLGMAEAELTLAVDVGSFVTQKRASIAAHRSQVTDTSFFLQMPDEMFLTAFGTEWFLEPGVDTDGPEPGWIFP